MRLSRPCLPGGSLGMDGASRAPGPDGRHQRARSPGAGDSLLGIAAGRGRGLIHQLAGDGAEFWAGARRVDPQGYPDDDLDAREPARDRPTCKCRSLTATRPVSPTSTPFYGTLEIPSQDDDGPPDGLTLDSAIDITLERSLDLRSKFCEIPMARADMLQASLRSNPIFYQDGQLLPVRGSPFTRAAPAGPSQFDTNITYPLDVSHKRQAERWWPPARCASSRRCSRMPSASGSTTSTVPMSRPWLRQTVRYCEVERQGAGRPGHGERSGVSKGDISLGELEPDPDPVPHREAWPARCRGRLPQGQLGLGSLMNLTSKRLTARAAGHDRRRVPCSAAAR